MKIGTMSGNLENCYLFAKNTKGEFIFCNESLAMAGGVDSPSQIIGMTDYDLLWRKQADFFRAIDDKIREGYVYVNQYELLETKEGKKIPVIVSKSQILNENNQCIGTIGFSFIIESQEKKGGQEIKLKNEEEKRYYLSQHEYLTLRELEVLKYVLLAYGDKKIANLMKISRRTVESHLVNLKRKLQCRTRGDIIVTAMRQGLLYLIKDAL